jgi:hypothetical protein
MKMDLTAPSVYLVVWNECPHRGHVPPSLDQIGSGPCPDRWISLNQPLPVRR